MKLTDVEKKVVSLAVKNEKDILKSISAILMVHADTKIKVKEELALHLNKYIRDDGRVDYSRLALPLTPSELAEYSSRVRAMNRQAKGNYYLEHWMKRATSQKPQNRLQAILLYASYIMAEFAQKWLETAENDLNALVESTFDDYLEYHGEYSEEGVNTNVFDTTWSDGYQEKSPRDRIIDSNDKVIIALWLMLERDMATDPYMAELEALIDKRFGIQANDVRRHMETYTTLSTNQALILAYEYLNLCLRHISVLDNRTTDLCRSRHGKVFPISEAVYGVTIPPLHWHCRSIVVEHPC